MVEEKEEQNIAVEHKSSFMSAFKGTLGKGLGCLAIVIIVVVVIAALAAGGDEKKEGYVTEEEGKSAVSGERGGTEEAQEQEQSPKIEEEEAEKSWHKVKEWSGTGIKTTEAFDIKGKQWRVTWTSKDTSGLGADIVGIMVKRPGADIPLSVISGDQGSGGDTSYIYESGEFILDINSANCRWTIVVEDYY